MDFLDLPTEVLTLCLSYLKGPDLSKLSQTCKALYDLTNDELLWQKRCLKEYGLKFNDGWGATFREIYGIVLHRYGCLLGLWRNTTDCYGGLVHVWHSANGSILGEEYFGQRDVCLPLVRKSLFQIRLSSEHKPVTKWLANFHGNRPCTINLDDVYSAGKFEVKWELDENATKLEKPFKEKQKFQEECDIRGTDRFLVHSKFKAHIKNQCHQKFSRLDLPACPADRAGLPLAPGLFMGMYGGHGTEIILLSYDPHDPTKAKCRKITGDSNVPAGEVSIYVSLNQPMYLDKDQQMSVDDLMNVETGTVTDEELETRQPFIVPYGISTEGKDHPNTCKARYASEGTVSPTGYSFPTQVPSHFIVFDENLFGSLWMTLSSFSLFSRVNEQFQTLSRRSLINDV